MAATKDGNVDQFVYDGQRLVARIVSPRDHPTVYLPDGKKLGRYVSKAVALEALRKADQDARAAGNSGEGA